MTERDPQVVHPVRLRRDAALRPAEVAERLADVEQPVSSTSSATPPRPSPASRPHHAAGAGSEALCRTAVGRTSELLATTCSCLLSSAAVRRYRDTGGKASPTVADYSTMTVPRRSGGRVSAAIGEIAGHTGRYRSEWTTWAFPRSTWTRRPPRRCIRSPGRRCWRRWTTAGPTRPGSTPQARRARQLLDARPRGRRRGPGRPRRTR